MCILSAKVQKQECVLEARGTQRTAGVVEGRAGASEFNTRRCVLGSEEVTMD